ncbi:MAG: hypothetical protein QOH78_2751 [Verrucomicrobiota bacterium]
MRNQLLTEKESGVHRYHPLADDGPSGQEKSSLLPCLTSGLPPNRAQATGRLQPLMRTHCGSLRIHLRAKVS